LTAKDFYDICCLYTDGYFRSLLYDFSQILIASEVLISTVTKNVKNAILQKNKRPMGPVSLTCFRLQNY